MVGNAKNLASGGQTLIRHRDSEKGFGTKLIGMRSDPWWRVDGKLGIAVHACMGYTSVYVCRTFLTRMCTEDFTEQLNKRKWSIEKQAMEVKGH